MNRDATIAAFLGRTGFGAAACHVLAEDASFRRYLRLSGTHQAVVMDAPPGLEDLGPFLHIRSHLAGLGLSVPAILAADIPQGLLVLEDFGDSLFPAIMTADNLCALYDAATDALAVLHAAPAPGGLPSWDAAAMQAAAAATFLDWWWPAAFAGPPTDTVRSDFAAAMARMLAPLRDQEQGFVHRDYFAGNLFWLPRHGVRRVGIIDFQDAAVGHPAYDLVSLVEDARRDLPDGLAARQIARYLAHRPELDAEKFRAAYAICAVHRHLRVAALWVRLARRDGKPAYLVHGARTWRLLERALLSPAAASMAAFLAYHVPLSTRGNPGPT